MSSGKQEGYPQQGYNQPQGYGYSVQHSTVMSQPQHSTHVVIQPGVRPSDYLVLTIVSCFFCWPMAICALVSSLNSRKSSDAGDYTSAQSQGRTARNIAIAAIVIGILWIVGAIIAVVVTQVIFASTVVSTYGLTING